MFNRPGTGYLNNLFILTVFIILSASIALYLGQDINWDLLNYHFYNGYAATHLRYSYDIAPALIQTYLNPVFDILNYYIIALQRPRLSTILLSLNSGLTAFIIFKIAEHLLVSVLTAFTPSMKKLIVFAAVMLGFISAVNISLLGTTTNDGNVSLLIIASLYYLICAQEVETKKYLLLSALLSGMAAGLKLTAVCYTMSLFISLALSNLGGKRYWEYCVTYGVVVVLGFLCVNAYWMVYLFQHYHSPLFPYYNNIFHSPYAPYLSFNLSPTGAVLTWHQFLFLPFYMALKTNAYFSERAIRDAHLLIILGLCAVYGYRRFRNQIAIKPLPAWEMLASFFGISYFIWVIQFGVYRYLLPLELLSGLIIVYLVFATFPKSSVRALLLLGITLTLALTTVYPNWGRKPYAIEYFTLTKPIVEPRAKILLASFPSAYVVPFFPKDSQFIGLTFLSLGEVFVEPHTASHQHNLFLTKTINKLYQTQDPIYSLTISKNHPERGLANNSTARSNVLLLHFGFIKKDCQVLTSNVGDEFQLCRLQNLR